MQINPLVEYLPILVPLFIAIVFFFAFRGVTRSIFGKTGQQHGIFGLIERIMKDASNQTHGRYRSRSDHTGQNDQSDQAGYSNPASYSDQNGHDAATGPRHGRPKAVYECEYCGAPIKDTADISPSGDSRCSSCKRWFNIYRG